MINFVRDELKITKSIIINVNISKPESMNIVVTFQKVLILKNNRSVKHSLTIKKKTEK